MNTRSITWLGAFSVIGLLCIHGAAAEEQPGGAANKESATQMGGMQHGGMGAGQSSQGGMGGMGGMQHGGMASDQSSQADMGGMQHGGPGRGMMGGMMPAMSDKELEEAFLQFQSQDIRLDELRRQMREANDQSVREKLKVEHRSVLKEHLALTHKLMMQQHMKSMMGAPMSGGESAPPPAQAPNP